MNLTNIEEYVPAILFERGADYYERGLVEGLKESAPNLWRATVAGTDDYDVFVILSDFDEILSSSCSCPFESDTLCKHEIAVCLAIEEHKGADDSDSPAVMDIHKQLKGLKKAELLELLEELAEREPTVKLFLMEKFLRKEGMDEPMARKLIRQSAKRASRSGFIGWNETEEALEGAYEVLTYVDSLTPDRDGEEMVRLYLTVIYECSKLLEMADDSSGSFGAVINGSADGIYEVLVQWPEQPEASAVDRILDLFYPHVLHHVKQDMTDVHSSLVGAVVLLGERSGFGGKVYEFIDRLIESDAMQNKKYKYDEEHFRVLQLQVLRAQGDQGAVDRFIRTHRDIPKIRKAEAAQAMEAGDFERAIRLCEESEELDATLPGLVDDWKKLRLEAYQKAGRGEEAVPLMYEFAAKGEEAYYRQLKAATNPEKWPELLSSLLKDMDKYWLARQLYISILLEEGMTAELLGYCKTRNYEIEALYPHLIKEYPQEVESIFASYIKELVASAADRKKYRAACRKIKIYRKALGAEAAAELIEELKSQYPQRPALLDELSKV